MQDNETKQKLLTNKPLTVEEEEKIASLLSAQERAIFAVSGDLSVSDKFARSLLVVTDKAICALDQALDGGCRKIPYSEIKHAYVKRYYGNAMLIIERSNEEKRINFIRFSNTVAPLFDAAAFYIQNITKGLDPKTEFEIVNAAFEKQMSVCPKCGRQLIRPGAECINCQSKNKIIKKLIHYISPYKYTLILCLVLSGVTTAVSLLPPYMTRRLVDDVLPGKDTKALIMVVVMLLGSYIIQYGIGTVRSYMMRVCGDKIVADLRSDIYNKAQYLTMKFYDRTSTGSVINRISNDTSNLQGFMLRVTQEVVVQFFLLIGIIIIMMSMNWQLTLLSLVPVPLVVIGTRTFGKKIRPFYHRIWRRWSSVSSVLTDTIPGIRVIKAFTNEKGAISNFDKYNNEWLDTDIKSARITTLFPHIVGFVITCGSLLIWGIGGRYVINDPEFISVGLLVSFISYTSMFYGPVNFFANLNDSYQSTLAATERILDIIDAEPENDFGRGKHPDRIKGKIEFRNVNFSFDRSKKTLSNINFVIEPGEIVGIVGTTGSGKSTLINLLMRYYDSYDGEILVDDVNIRDIDMEFYRGEIGYVQQEPMMFRDTIFNNIAYGNDNTHVEQIMKAADVANAHEFIARLPDAYDTVLGERGVGLSGGERQRLSIARAVLKNPSILFFDEATAAVDSETESLIQDAIERLISGRTTLMIAHRLSTLRNANKIIVVDKGEIIEMGTPDELMALKGKYYKLIQIQTMTDQIRKTKEEENLE